MRYQGRITQWKDDKGFGFITPNGGGEKLFVHISAFRSRHIRPSENTLVTYEQKTDEKGRLQATAVSFVGDAARAPVMPSSSPWPVVFATAFLLLILAFTLTGPLPPILLGYYLTACLITFMAYAMDKSAARRNAWRTAESTLHLLSLMGGWPGALIAQRRLRHKSAKDSFLAVYWLTVILNCAALAWLLTEGGARTLQNILGLG